jgi:CheY-like chemotaxis protein
MRPGIGQEVDGLTREEFLRHLRDALNHLHDADYLRRSQLASLVGVAKRLDTSSTVRRILTDAIASLKPHDDDPCYSHAWQMHDALFYCYVQRLSQRVVADQLAVSPRQLRREQHAALEALADRLCEQYGLQENPPIGPVPPTTSEEPPAVSDELAWLRNLPPEKPTDASDTLSAVLDTVRPLALQHQVRLDARTIEALPKVAAHPVALNQVLLSLLGVAISQTPGGQVRVTAHSLGQAVEIRIEGDRRRTGLVAMADEDRASLDMARHLAEICAGQVIVCGVDAASFSATLTLPALERLPVLVIDDNADTLQLLERYTAGTRYRLTGLRDPEQAVSLAETLEPQIIVLDVMMPQVDGWKVLGRLRQHPHTAEIPIIVCTILPQESLALSLGASALLRKPITRQALLHALDGQAPATAPH